MKDYRRLKTDENSRLSLNWNLKWNLNWNLNREISKLNYMKGNAVVNQVASLSYLFAPMLGGVLYAMLGLKPVMYASVVCFFMTALFECFIKLSDQRIHNQGNVIQLVKQDFLSSMQYISKEQTNISKMLLLTAFVRFFVMGITIVGLPFLVRIVLGLNAKYYGAAESA